MANELSPQIAGRYTYDRELGRGSSGRVLLVRDAASGGERLALKLVGVLAEEQVRAEFALLSRIAHPNLARVRGVFRVEEAVPALRVARGTLALLSEFAPGVAADRAVRALATHAPSRNATSTAHAARPGARDRMLAFVLRVCDRTARALAAVHRQGFVHGDIKPANLIVSDDGRELKLIDLGLARAPGFEERPSGTPECLAPELFRGELSPAADVYALGVTAWRLLAPPTAASSDATVAELLARSLADPRVTEPLPSWVPPAFVELLVAMRAADRARRPQNAREVSVELTRLAAALPAELAAEISGEVAEKATWRERALAVSALPIEGQVEAQRELTEALAAGRAVAVVGPEGSGRSRLIREVVFALQLARAQSGEPVPVYRVSGDVPARLEAGPCISHVVDADGVRALDVERFVRACEVEKHASVLVLERTRPLDAPNVRQVRIAPLARNAVERLLGHVVGSKVKADVIDEALAVSGGLAANLCRTLSAGLAAGRDLSKPGDLRRASTVAANGGALPELSESARRLAALACVAGGSLAHERLEACFDDPAELSEAEQWVCALGLASRATNGRLRFRSDVARKLWVELGAQQRAALARSIRAAGLTARDAEASSDAHAANDRALAARSDAFLACAADEAIDAARHFASGLERAIAAGDPAAAVGLAREAGELLGAEGRTPSISVLHAYALRALGDYADALHVLDAAPAADGGEIAGARAEISRLRGETENAAQIARSIVSSADTAVAHAARALLARLRLDAGDAAEAEREARAVHKLAGEQPAGLRAAEVLALALIHQGRDDDARAVLDPALAAARARGERAAEARLWSVQGSRQRVASQLRAAANSFGRAFELADAAGEFHAAASFLVNLGTAQLDAGELGTALDTLREGARRLARLGRERDVARTLYNLALARQLVGDASDALNIAVRAEQVARSAGDVTGAAFAVVLRAEIAKEAGEAAQARVELDLLSELDALAASDRVAIEARASAVLAGLSDEAAAAVHLARAEAAAQHAAGEEVELLLARAAVAGLRREWHEAQRDAEAALARAAERGEFALQISALTAAAHAAEQRSDVALMRARLSELRAQLDAAARTLTSADRGRLRDVRAYRAALSALPASVAERSGEAAARAPDGASSGAAAAGGDPRFQRLAGIAKRLTAETEPRRLYELLLDSAIDLTHAESGFLMLRDAEGELRVRAARTLGERDQAERTISHSIVTRVFTSGQALSTVDAIRDSRLSGASSVHALALRSVLGVPLRSADEIFGVIYLDDRLRPFAFGEAEVALLTDLADLAAIALEAIGRLRRERRAVRRLRATQAELARRIEAQALEIASWKGKDSLASEHAGIVAHSPAMREALELAVRVGRSEVPVLIRGESGTGKELIAKAIHAASSRKDAPFVSENCGAIPETLLESTLFGHVKGAFTGADRRHHGLFEAADGGTLFLDEIGEMSPSMQVRLLRVLQDGEVRPIGGERATRVDVRVLCATHRDVDAMLERGGFREDLFYRLAVVSLALPPLRERGDDIMPLISHFLAKYAPGRATKIDKRVAERLLTQPWPGNVRQLENEVRRALALASGDTLREEHFSVLSPRVSQGEISDLDLRAHVDELERKLIKRALEAARGNQTRAADLLGVSRFGLQKMLKRLFPDAKPTR